MKRLLFPLFCLALVVGAPSAYYYHQQFHYRNFRIVNEGKLYRSGQLSPAGLHRIWHEYGIATIVSLRDDDGLSGVKDPFWEQEYARKQEIVFVRIAPKQWSEKKAGPPPAEENVRRFLEIIHDPVRYPRPMLIHCFKGSHRTGIYVALYRMEVDRWSNEEALREMRRCGYDTLDTDEDIHAFLRQYVPSWKKPSPPVTPQVKN